MKITRIKRFLAGIGIGDPLNALIYDGDEIPQREHIVSRMPKNVVRIKIPTTTSNQKAVSISIERRSFCLGRK